MITDKITKRLSVIQENYRLLEIKLDLDKEAFLQNPDNYLTTERLLHLISEAMIDIGNHILARKQLGKPETYSEIFIILAKKNVIRKELGDKLAVFAGLRNILVHDYIGLDRERLYKETKENKEDIKSFIDQIGQYIQENQL